MEIKFKNNNEFVSIGLDHYRFWNINDNKLFYKNPKISNNKKLKLSLGTVALCEDIFITGNSLGELMTWKNEKFLTSAKIFLSNVDTLYSNNAQIFGGSRDMTIAIINKKLSILKVIQIDNNSFIYPIPRSIDIFPWSNNKILIGTLGGDITELIFKKNFFNEEPKYKFYLSSHFSSNYIENNAIIDILFWKKKLFITI